MLNPADGASPRIDLPADDAAARERALDERERDLKERTLAAALDEARRRREWLAEFDERSAALMAGVKELERRSETLRQREEAVRQAEIERDNGFAEQRRAFEAEQADQRRRMAEDVASRRRQALKDLDAQVDRERTERFAAVTEEAARQRRHHEDTLREAWSDLERQREQVRSTAERAESHMQAREEALVRRDAEVRLREMEIAAMRERLEAELDALEDKVEEQVAVRRRSFEATEKRMEQECARLRSSLAASDARFNLYAQLQQSLGDDPATMLTKMEEAQQEIVRLNHELLRRPSEDLKHRYEALLKEQERERHQFQAMSRENETLRAQARDQGALQAEILTLKSDVASLERRNRNLDDTCAKLEADLKRLNAGYEREADGKARIREIEIPFFPTPHPRQEGVQDEIAWLDNIEKKCAAYGLRFHRRMLHAFHTALKTAEWSPLTVLAGVSGTGKSELPRLYSHFGGLKFLNVPVQPNWDSQESMLGFFNSIDNKFDAQPLLRLLAQTQKPVGDGYPGLDDAMTMILLDEMNLAHVELYFAEFLSKLEFRRGRSRAMLPALEVKLGAGIEPYRLPLGRNVLWTGTMNQDETTKSLSDKVIDRGFVIHFPSPSSFERRTKMEPLPREETVPLLRETTWRQWRPFESAFTDQQIRPYKGMVEQINAALGHVGKALGHRVWQSLEYYMANYPDVRAAKDERGLETAMRMAFEDQLVLKVMPKLRGIDTRGRSRTECLDRIRNLIVEDGYAIVDDFDRACAIGYGQFMWNSADYLRPEEESVPAEG